jgi:hypothetical protein
MKKVKLIKLLEDIPGNPDILLWNGYVQDWVPIDPKLVRQLLVKESFEHYCESYRLEKCVERKEWDYQLSEEKIEQLKQGYKKFDWEFNNYVTQEMLDNKDYFSKPIYFIQSKPRGVETFDRLGAIAY